MITNQHSFFSRPRLWGLLCGLTLAVAQFFSPVGAGVAHAATTTCTPNGSVLECTVTFAYSGAAETWTVPAGVTSATFDLYGAQGRPGDVTGGGGGNGGRTTATWHVTAGTTYQIRVGGRFGYNGGGAGGTSGNSGNGGGGGGASDVRGGAFGLADRLLVAGGGGGGGARSVSSGGAAGGYPSGGGSSVTGGGGGTQTTGGAGGVGDANGSAGSLGQGGAGGSLTGAGGGGGGGGGGYYGGGGGSGSLAGGGGGGGSSFGPSGATFQNGVRAGDGLVIISYSQPLPDTTAPVANPTQSPAAAPSGWNNTDVTVSWNWSDPATSSGSVSGIDPANCTNDSTSSGEGTITLSATCQDLAGNTGSATYQVKVDKTAPTVLVTGVSDGAAYEVGAVPTAACSTSDALSGVATPATLSVTGGNLDGTGSFTATCSGATDVAGNSAAPVSVTYTVNPPPDTTAPVITPNVVGTLGNNGWYVSDVTVSWSVVDNESAISNQSGCETQNVTSDTAGVTFTCSATSSGGSSSESVTIKRDATAPTVSATASSAPNGNGWYNSNVTVQFTCADNLSGVVSCPADQILSSEGTAVASTAQTISDQAGNSSAASNVVTVQLDKTAPVVAVTGVSNGASYTVGSAPVAGCSTSDALSGVATQATLSVSGGNADGTGSFTATCSGATDNAGNSGGASVTYSVLYNWSGFFQPVDNLPTVNTVNAGQAIPVKFSLGGNYGLNIFASGYPQVQAVSCGGNGGSSSPIEETVTAGNSSLQYDPATQRYTYVWKTDKAWGGTCRQLVVRLVDGSEHVALFQFNGKGRSADAGEEALAQQLFLPLVSR
ncbi:MAG: PxKF domain-containing protein [Caldilineaceae bacterium]|nr:PxKF domain-containing protein [Caldilineaceae bacterium]